MKKEDAKDALLHELFTHRIELEQQNEELRLIQANLAESHQKYTSLYDFAPVGYLTINPRGVILEANLTVAELLGIPRNSLVNKRFSDHIHPEDQDIFYLHLKSLRAGKGNQSCELRILAENRAVLWVKLTSSTMDKTLSASLIFIITVSDIADQKHLQEIIRKDQRRAQSLLGLFQRASGSADDLIQIALEEVVGLTGSDLGFIGFIDDEATTMSTHLWSTRAMQHCSIENKPQLFPLNRGGLWTSAITQRETVIVNDYALPHPDKRGIPEGHVPLHRLLVLPVLEKERVKMVCGLANKPEDYTEDDTIQVNLFMEGLMRLVQRKKMEEELKQVNRKLERQVLERTARLRATNRKLRDQIGEYLKAQHEINRLNRLYSVLSLVNKAIVKTNDSRRLFREICRVIIRYGRFRMAWVGLLNEETKTIEPHTWAGHENNYLATIKRISLTRMPGAGGPTATAVKTGEYKACNDIANDPIMAPWRTEALKRGYKSSIALPIKTAGAVVATLNLYASEPNAFASPGEIQLLQEISDSISFSLQAMEVEKIRKKNETEILASREQLRALSLHMEAVREKERIHVAREIHDELGHLLTALKVDLDNLTLSQASVEVIQQELHPMISMVDGLIDSVRKIAAELRPGVLDHLGLIPAMEWLVEQFRLKTKIQCTLDLREPGFPLGKTETTQIFRILQEILTNITRHAEATRVFITMGMNRGRLFMEVTDNGSGFDPEEQMLSGSLGLVGMRERAASIQGEIRVRSEKGKGSTVTLLIRKKSPSSTK